MMTMTSTTASETDLAAIREVVATVEYAQRNESVDGFVNLFHPEAIWTTGGGKVLIGRDAIAEFTAQVLPGATAGGYATYEIAHIRLVRPDVAAVKIRQRYFHTDGTPDSEGAPLYVMTKEDGRWLLTVCQNTPVRDH